MQESEKTEAHKEPEPVRNWRWRVSWQEGIYYQIVCFEAETSDKAADLFQTWLALHNTTIPMNVRFHVELPNFPGLNT